MLINRESAFEMFWKKSTIYYTRTYFFFLITQIDQNGILC